MSGNVGARSFISANSFKSQLNSPKYIFFNTGFAPVCILCQIICNRLVARIALQQWYSVIFDTCPLGWAI